MKYHWLLPLASALLNAVLGIVVITRDRRARLNQAFLLMSVAVSLWNLNNFVLYAIVNPQSAMWWSQLLRTGTILMPSTILQLILELVTVRRSVSSWVLRVSYGLSIILVVANWNGLLVSGVTEHPWGWYPVGTSLYGFYLGSVIVHCTLALGLLVREYRITNSPWRRLQARFWLLGAVVAMPMGLGNFLPIYGMPFYPTGHLGTVIYAGIIAYAVVVHRLMDIELVITKGMAYGLVSLALIAPAYGLTLWLQRSSFGQIHTDFSFALLLLLLAVGVLFPTFRLRAESRIEQSLFPEKRQHREALATFAGSIVRILDRNKLVNEVVNTLSDTLGLNRVAIALFDPDAGGYFVAHSLGAASRISAFPREHPLIEVLREGGDLVLREELESGSEQWKRREAARACQENGWEVCLPLATSGNLMGFVGLGQKRNLEAFYVEDLQLLSTVAAEVAIALENARLYEELRRSRDIIQRTDRLSALGTLAAGIAHEIRNPLVSIQTFFQLAPHRMDDQEFFTEFLSLTTAEVQRISNLITELLSFAKSKAHSPQQVDLNDLVERTTVLLEPEARKHQVVLRRLAGSDLPPVRADADQIMQVAINLVLNAIQATQPGGSITVSTRKVMRPEGTFSQIEVADTGLGIPAKVIEDIFNPFFTTKDKGTGLGLSIAHQIVAEHGGFIAVTSEEGHGSSFYLNLPCAPAAIPTQDVGANVS